MRVSNSEVATVKINFIVKIKDLQKQSMDINCTYYSALYPAANFVHFLCLW